ncbi:MAG: hypothetical protein ABIS92_06715 [Polyangia bacterium]
MFTGSRSLTTTILALTVGCGGRHPQTPGTTTGADAAADAAAPDGDEAAPSTALDAVTPSSDAAPPSTVPPVDPEVSRRWAWSPCGQLSPAPIDSAGVFAADGTMVVRSEDGTIRGYAPNGARRPGLDGTAGFLLVAPDGTTLTGVVTGPTIVLQSVGSTTARFQFNVPEGMGCGHTYGFSVGGDYFLAHGGGPSCIWRTADGGFVAMLPGSAAQAAIRGVSLVTLEARPDELVDIVTRNFGGNETSRVKLETQLDGVLLSPAGDRVASPFPTTSTPLTLWDTDGRTLLAIAQSEGSVFVPIFTAAGDRLLLGNGVFQSADGARTATLPPLNRLRDGLPFALSADGRRVIARAYGRAALFEVAALGITAVLGPQLSYKQGLSLSTLAISRDSVLAVATGGAVFGIRIAPRLEESVTLWSIYAGDFAFIGDISEDGRWASAAGDNRALYSAVDGRRAWPSPPPPSALRCFGTQLRISPMGNWAAGASYGGTMDVFSLADAGLRASWPVSMFPSACQEAAAFSRDERTLATSTPSLFRFDATAATWQPVWSQSVNSAPPYFPSSLELPDVRFSPDETRLLVSRCDVKPCTAILYDTATGALIQKLPELTSPRPSFSPEGSWIVAGPKLLHLPSGDTRPLDPSSSASAAVFAPNGDIVAGSNDGVLTRYCRGP